VVFHRDGGVRRKDSGVTGVEPYVYQYIPEREDLLFADNTFNVLRVSKDDL
jgi:hypothetical protein